MPANHTNTESRFTLSNYSRPYGKNFTGENVLAFFPKDIAMIPFRSTNLKQE